MPPQRRFNLTEIGHLDDVQSFEDNLNDIWGYVDGGVEYALVGRRDRMDVVDISTTPSNPTVVSSISGPTSLWRDVKTKGEYAFVVHDRLRSGSPTGLQVVDLSDPTSASVATTHTAAFERAHNIWVEGDYLYACSVKRPDGSDTGLVVLDVSDPTNPAEVGAYTGAHVHDIYVRGDRAYAAAEKLPGVKILDVNDPANPTEIGQFKTPENLGHNTWLSDDGDYCFVTNEVLGGHLRFYDVSDPTNPFQVAEYQVKPDRVIHNVYVAGGVAFISYYSEGVVLLDVSDPANPRELAVYDTSDQSIPDPPTSNRDAMHGIWGLYPFFPSGRIAASDIEGGLYVFERTRSPVDVVMCLDRSGSMDQTVPSGSLKKFELLQRAAGLFTATWAPFATPDDRLGAVFFETGVTAYTPPGGGSLLRLFQAEQSAIDSYVDGQTTGNRTAMGVGLKRALEAFDSDRDARRVVVLFTDGKQNVDPKVKPDSDSDLRLDGRLLADYDAEIYTIGTGVSGASWESLLGEIASQTNGRHHFTDAPDQDLRDFFEDHLVRALRGQTLQRVGATQGVLDGEASHEFCESGTARRIAFTLAWDGESTPEMQVLAPDGTPIRDPDHSQRGDHHHVVSYRVPIVVDGRAIDTAGEWTVTVDGRDGTAYRVSMLVDDWELHPRFELPTGPLDIGQRLSIGAAVETDGSVLERVTGSVACPTEALGERLAETGLGDEIDRPAELDAYERALARLPRGMRQETALELRSDGTRTETSIWPAVPGTYDVSLEMKGETATGAPFQRHGRASVSVPARVVPETTNIDREDRVGHTQWEVEPRDCSGARLGPGLADQIAVEPAVRGLETSVEDVGDGRYVVEARYDEPGLAKALTLTISGVRASSPVKPGSEDEEQGGQIGREPRSEPTLLDRLRARLDRLRLALGR